MQPDAANTIVVVDDDPLVADVFTYGLKADLGPAIRVLTADRAMELLAATRWRLAIIDVMLPRRSGVEIAQGAVAMGTPVLLATGDFRATTTLRRYGYPVLQKPMTMEALVAEARMAIAQGESLCDAFRRSTADMLEDEGRSAADPSAGSGYGRYGGPQQLSAAGRSTGECKLGRLVNPCAKVPNVFRAGWRHVPTGHENDCPRCRHDDRYRSADDIDPPAVLHRHAGEGRHTRLGLSKQRLG